MSTYLIALAIEVEPGQGNPGKWNWAEVVDTPLPCDVITSFEVPGDTALQENLTYLAERLEFAARILPED